MKLGDLLKKITPIKIDGCVCYESEVVTATSINECRDNSLLFVTQRVSGGYTIDARQIEKYPYAIVCDSNFNIGDLKIPCIRVENVRQALSLSYIEEYCIDFSKVRIIGVTGTNGKTTTATLIYKIMMHSHIKAGLIGTGTIRSGERDITPENYTMTTPDPSLLYAVLRTMIDDGCTNVVMEVSSHSIALEKIYGMKFEYAIFTNLSAEHMDFHETMDEYFDVKLRLLEAAKHCIINIDDKYGEIAYSKNKHKATGVGVIRRGDVYATDIAENGLAGSKYFYRTDKYIFSVNLKLAGAFNIYNSMLALCCAIHCGIKPCVAKKGLSSVENICGRLEVIRKDPTVIIDYAHTPFALDNILKTLKLSKKYGQRLIVLFGCGGERDKSKRPVMGNIASGYADYIVLTEDNSRREKTSEIIADIISGIPDRTCYTVIDDRRSAIRHALAFASKNDIVAIIGKGHEHYKIDGDGTHYFNEKAIVFDFYKAPSGGEI